MRMMLRTLFACLTMAFQSVHAFFSAVNRACTSVDLLAEYAEDEARNFRDVGRVERHAKTLEIQAQFRELGIPLDSATTTVEA